MSKTNNDRPFLKRLAIDFAGFGLMIISPFLGILPGPGGIPLFLVGLGLVATNHEWAENLLLNFEKKREHFTTKILMSSPAVSRSVDVIGIAVFIASTYVVVTQSDSSWRFVGLPFITISLIILFSNQKRFERISTWLKSAVKRPKK